MELKASNLQIKKSLNGDTELIFSVADKDNKIAKLISEDTTLKEFIRLNFSKWREKRSLDANAYFHLLIGKMAKVLNKSETETKIEMNLEYGTPARNPDGTQVIIKLPKETNIRAFYDYAKWYADKTENGKTLSYYIFYKQTHTLNTKQMAQLIDGVINECKELGIETISTEQKQAMLKSYEERYGVQK